MVKILAMGDFHGKFPNRLKRIARRGDIDLIVCLGDYTGLDDWYPIVMKQLKLGKEGKEVLSHEEIMGEKNYRQLVKKDYLAGQKVLQEINKLGKKSLIIFGNGDWYKFSVRRGGKSYEKYCKKLRNIKQINYGVYNNLGFSFVGFGGYMDIDSYFNKKEWGNAKNKMDLKIRIQRREKMKKLFSKLLGKSGKNRIFILHYPPKGAFDIIKGGKKNHMTGKSTGIGFFTEAINKYKPKLVLCGHMHEYQGKKMMGGSLVVNPGAAKFGKAAIIDTDNRGVEFVK